LDSEDVVHDESGFTGNKAERAPLLGVELTGVLVAEGLGWADFVGVATALMTRAEAEAGLVEEEEAAALDVEMGLHRLTGAADTKARRKVMKRTIDLVKNMVDAI
jgi:hypothetical protein